MKALTDWVVNLDCQLQLKTLSGSAFTNYVTCRRSGSRFFRKRCTYAPSGRFPTPCWMSYSFESLTWRTFQPMRLSSWLISARWFPPHCLFYSWLHQQRYFNPIIILIVSILILCLRRITRTRQIRLVRWCTTSICGRDSRSCSVCWVLVWKISKIVGRPEGVPSVPTFRPMKSNKWFVPYSRILITVLPSWLESNNFPRPLNYTIHYLKTFCADSQ